MSAAAPERPNLLPTAGLVSLFVLLLGATGLFALGYTDTKSAAALERLGWFHDAQVAAVEAQVSFKTQVQEWKNLLLRGRDSADRKTYLDRFEARAADVRAGLESVQQQLVRLGQDDSAASRLLADHAALGDKYRQALAAHSFEDPASAFALDAAVRGIDRHLNEEIDALSRTVEAAALAEITTFRTAAASRYATLRKVTLGCGALAVLSAFWLVFQAARLRDARRGA